MSSVAHVALVPRGVRVDMSEVAHVAAALATQVIRDFSPIWGITATVSAFPKAADVPVGYWPIFIEDPMKLPDGAAGVHLDKRNQPYALVEAGDKWSLSASHECLEMLVDPSGNRLHAGPLLEEAVQLGLPQHEVQYVVEVCDPVEDGQFGYQINGVLVSDFFTPNFYDPAAANGVRYDFMGVLSGPLQLAPNGYISWLDPVSGEAKQLQNFYGPDHRLHPQVVNLSHSNMFQEVLAKESFRPAIDRVTVSPDLLASMSREQHVEFEQRFRAVKHASQIHARRIQDEISHALAVHEEQLGESLVPAG